MDALEAVRHKPFDKGHHNCVLMSANIAEAITGRDFIPEYPRGDYRAQRAMLRAEGGIEAAVGKRLAKTTLGRSRRGDVALTLGKRPALVVIDPPYAWGVGPDGLQRLDWTQLGQAYCVE